MAAWAAWLYNEIYPSLADTFDEATWTVYAHHVVAGRRPFPWSDALPPAERERETLLLFQRTCAWVAQDAPDRVLTALGLAGVFPLYTTRPTNEQLYQSLTQCSVEAGNVSREMVVALQDGHVDADEALRIGNACDASIARLSELRALAEAVRASERNKKEGTP